MKTATDTAPETKTRTPKTFATEGNKRVPKALKALAMVAALAKYEPTEDQVEKVTTALEAALENVKDAFTTEETATTDFSL